MPDVADTLPAIAALASGQPGGWWDSTSGLTAGAWVDRMNGHTLTAGAIDDPSGGSGVPSIVAGVQNGRSAVRLDGTAFYGGTIEPIGANPSAFMLALLFDPALTDLGTAVSLLESFGQNDGSDIGISVAAIGEAQHAIHGLVYNINTHNTEGWTENGNDALDPASATDGSLCLFEILFDSPMLGARFYLNGVNIPIEVLGGDEALPFQEPFNFGVMRLGASAYATDEAREMDGFHCLAIPAVFGTSDHQTYYTWLTAVYGVELPYLLPIRASDTALTVDGGATAMTPDAGSVGLTPN